MPYALEMCERSVKGISWTLEFVLGQYRTTEMCNKDLEDLYNLAYIIYYFETQDMCIEAIREELHLLEFVTNRFQTKKICNKAGRKNSF